MKGEKPRWTDNRLNGWIFTNTDGIWYTTTRDNYFALFNGENEQVLSSRDIVTLQDIIIRTDGDLEKIKKLVNE